MCKAKKFFGGRNDGLTQLKQFPAKRDIGSKPDESIFTLKGTLMTPLQIRSVQESFALIAPDRVLVASLFYGRLFALDPSLRPLFTGDMVEQGRKLMNMLKLIVHALDNIGGLVPFIAELGNRHQSYGVRDDHYSTVGAALIWTLEQGLRDEFTDHCRQSWAAAYDLIATTMQEGAARARYA